MKKLGPILLLVGGLLIALLIGVLVGRNQRAEPLSEGNSGAAVQITTAPPPSLPPPTPLPLPTTVPAPVEAPPPAPIPRIAPDLQVQEDAAAVGMTTLDDGDVGIDEPKPKSAATHDEEQVEPPFPG